MHTRTSELAAFAAFGNDVCPYVGSIIKSEGNYLMMRDYGVILNAFHPTSCYVDLVKALQFAHDHGIVHNDLRNPNVLVNSNHAILVDWGYSTREERYSDDLVNLVKLYLTNKIFLGISPVDDERATVYDFIRLVPQFCRLLFDYAFECDYNNLVASLSTATPSPVQARTLLFDDFVEEEYAQNQITSQFSQASIISNIPGEAETA